MIDLHPKSTNNSYFFTILSHPKKAIIFVIKHTKLPIKPHVIYLPNPLLFTLSSSDNFSSNSVQCPHLCSSPLLCRTVLLLDTNLSITHLNFLFNKIPYNQQNVSGLEGTSSCCQLGLLNYYIQTEMTIYYP